MGDAGREWYRDFFDRDYLAAYEPFHGPRRDRDEALGAMQLAGCSPPARVLDVPCGYGRHAIVLAGEGYDVVGLDLSEVQLAEAHRRAARTGAAPRFDQGDFRALPYPDASFDAALNLFTSFGYLGDAGDARVLAELHRVLRPGGRLVLETMHRDRIARILRPTTWQRLPDGGLVLVEHDFDPVAGEMADLQIRIRPDGSRSERQMRLRIYTATELVRMLVAAGFGEVACFGGLDGSPFLGSESRLVAVAAAEASGS